MEKVRNLKFKFSSVLQVFTSLGQLPEYNDPTLNNSDAKSHVGSASPHRNFIGSGLIVGPHKS